MITLLRLVEFKGFANGNVPYLFVKGDRRTEYIRG